MGKFIASGETYQKTVTLEMAGGRGQGLTVDNVTEKKLCQGEKQRAYS
jgi:hypothetical protein